MALMGDEVLVIVIHIITKEIFGILSDFIFKGS